LLSDGQSPRCVPTASLGQATSRAPQRQRRAIHCHGEESVRHIATLLRANVGQSDASVEYLARANGYSLFLSSKETAFLLKADSSAKQQGTKKVSPEISRFERGSWLRLQFPNSNPNALMSPVEEQVGKINYLIGSDPKSWHVNIPTYAKVKQRNLYPWRQCCILRNSATTRIRFPRLALAPILARSSSHFPARTKFAWMQTAT